MKERKTEKAVQLSKSKNMIKMTSKRRFIKLVNVYVSLSSQVFNYVCIEHILFLNSQVYISKGAFFENDKFSEQWILISDLFKVLLGGLSILFCWYFIFMSSPISACTAGGQNKLWIMALLARKIYCLIVFKRHGFFYLRRYDERSRERKMFPFFLLIFWSFRAITDGGKDILCPFYSLPKPESRLSSLLILFNLRSQKTAVGFFSSFFGH